MCVLAKRRSSRDSKFNLAAINSWLTICFRFVQTLCHCVASDSKQLSFEKGMLLLVVKDTEDSDWLLCRHYNNDGLVHRACVVNFCNDRDASVIQPVGEPAGK